MSAQNLTVYATILAVAIAPTRSALAAGWSIGGPAEWTAYAKTAPVGGNGLVDDPTQGLTRTISFGHLDPSLPATDPPVTECAVGVQATQAPPDGDWSWVVTLTPNPEWQPDLIDDERPELTHLHVFWVGANYFTCDGKVLFLKVNP